MKSLTCILTILLLTFPVYSAETDRINIGDFSSGRIEGWETKIFNGETHYRIIEIDGLRALYAHSQASASGLVKKIRIDLEKYPFLNWSWRVERRPGTLDELTKAGDDYGARVYVVVHGGLFFWNTKAVNYVWANKSPKGHTWPNAYASKNAMMMALRSKEDNSSTWYFEKRNVREDFRKLFGEETRSIDAVALMTDTDDSKEQAISYYGDIFFSSR
ncbi:MAG: DUF3047 domain-containing protein [Thermodesulfobacteriota bacterium]|nr:DUF3047 domain-containing protein [Thermodesulfobacteriota bacterium]